MSEWISLDLFKRDAKCSVAYQKYDMFVDTVNRLFLIAGNTIPKGEER